MFLEKKMTLLYDQLKEFAEKLIDDKKVLTNDDWFCFNGDWDINIYDHITPDSRTVVRADAYQISDGNNHVGNSIRLF